MKKYLIRYDMIVLPKNGHLECLKYAHENGREKREREMSVVTPSVWNEKRLLFVGMLPKMVTSSV